MGCARLSRWLKAGSTCGWLWGLGLVFGVVAGCRPPDDIQAPSFELREVHVRRYSGGRANLELALVVQNPNAFEISLVSLDCVLTISDREIGQIAWSGEALLGPNAVTTTPIPARFAVGDAAEIFTALIDRNAVAYRLTGSATLARGVLTREAPVAAAGRLNASAAER